MLRCCLMLKDSLARVGIDAGCQDRSSLEAVGGTMHILEGACRKTLQAVSSVNYGGKTYGQELFLWYRRV